MKPTTENLSNTTFYHLKNISLSDKVCQGTACFVARHLNQELWKQAERQLCKIFCLGKCYAAPATTQEATLPKIEIKSSQSIVLRRIQNGRSLERYVEAGGYRVLKEVLQQKPSEIIESLRLSNLRGRGGAAFPTWKKWQAVASMQADRKYVVVNADEGDSGAFIDRFIIENDPHCLIEAALIAGYTVGANQGFIYLRKEYPQALSILSEAIKEAHQAGMLGAYIGNSSFNFDIEIVVGEGSYVCGEETALLNSIEGKRPTAHYRPPYPTQAGLWGKPTLINNVETLANIGWIVENGGEAYAKIGFSKSQGTKVVSLNSLFHNPGLYEVDFGIPVRTIVEEFGGGLKTGDLKGVIIGGPLAGIIPPDLLDTRFGFEELRAIGASVGHGGVVAFDQKTSIIELMHHIFSFG
ncbi:MAG: NADH-quinone oxidoreductase subunit D, partial [Blastocatellia bacterium]|nr:NADH-quinone oxidoreductase subunit D [Blastocatellia bacterium]